LQTLLPFKRGNRLESRASLGRNDPLCRIVAVIAKGILFLFYDLKTEGARHLPRHDAFILLPKHQCWQDIPLIALATPRPLYYIAKHELFQGPVSGRFMRSLGGIPLNRQNPLKSRDSLRAMIHYLQAGEGVVVFPEGTYYRGKMGPGKAGILRLIMSRLSLPLVPAGVHYTRKGIRIRVNIHFGRPLYPDKTGRPNRILNAVMRQIALLSRLE